MRIVCQKCAAAYAIEDRLSPKGARARCPRCQHIQWVRREDALPRVASPTIPAMPIPRYASPTVPAMPIPSAASPTVPAMPIPRAAFPSSSPPTKGALALPFDEPDEAERNGEVDSELIDDRLLAPRLAERHSPARDGAACASCGEELKDAFDRALGTCTRCSARAEQRGEVTEITQSGPSDREVTLLAPPPPSRRSRPALRVAPPGVAAPASERGGVPSPPPPPPPPLQLLDSAEPYEAEATQESMLPDPASGADIEATVTGVSLAGRAPPLSQRTLVLAGLLFAVVLLAGVISVIVYQRGEEAERARVAIPEAVMAAVARWTESLGEPKGESSAHLAEAGTQLSLDTPAGYALAVRGFQNTLMLDARSDEAIAGYVQAISLGWTDGLDPLTYDEALALIKVAEARSQRDPSTLVAHANLLLTRGSGKATAEPAKALADEALTRAKGLDRAEALVVKGRVLLATSASLGSRALQEALTLPEAPKRAHYYRALAHRALGEYGAALGQLQRRLAMDPAHLESLSLVGKIYEEVGEPTLARDAYTKAQEKAPHAPQIRIALAALRYRALSKPTQAIDALKLILKEPSLESEVRKDALVHLAAAQRVAGKLDAALATVDEALLLAGASGAVHLQGFLAALEAQQPQVATVHLTGLKGKLNDPALELVLEGRLAVLQQRFADATGLFVKAQQLDARRVDALLWAGAAAASAGQKEEAFRHLAAALQLDPTTSGPLPEDARLHVTEEDLLSGIENRVSKLPGPDPFARLYEGLVRFHAGDLAAADSSLRQVGAEEGAAAGYALRALIALSRNDRFTAKSQAERALRADPKLALAHYAQGEALLAGNDLEGAGRALQEAHSLASGVLAVEVGLAEVDAKAKRPDEARKRLAKVVGVDPSYLAAKKALYALEP